jgi:phosphoglycerol transferase MdoB-like AlkP superfamily enzyme
MVNYLEGKMENQSNSNITGIGFCGLLGVAFIVLKLTGVIEWPWLWVLSPLWIPWAVILTILIVALLIAAVADVSWKRK